jgi:hypothetical protein
MTSFDCGADVLEVRCLALVRTDGDETNLTDAGDHEHCAARNIVCIDTKCVMNTVGSRDSAAFIEEHEERISVLLDVLLALKQSVDFLSCDEEDGCASPCEFVVSGLKLSHLARAIGSPCATDKNEYQRFPAVIR